MTRVVCHDCGISNEINDPEIAHDLAEGHADRHSHTVEVEGEEATA